MQDVFEETFDDDGELDEVTARGVDVLGVQTPLVEAFLSCRASGTAPPPRSEWSGDLLVSMYIELSKIKDRTKSRLKSTQAALDDLEEDVVQYFQAEEKQKDTRRGRTVYITQELWPKIYDDDLMRALPPDASKELKTAARERARQRLIEALRDDPTTAHLVSSTYNGNTLRSWLLNDVPEDPQTFKKVIPEHLSGKLGVTEKSRAKVLKAE